MDCETNGKTPMSLRPQSIFVILCCAGGLWWALGGLARSGLLRESNYSAGRQTAEISQERMSKKRHSTVVYRPHTIYHVRPNEYKNRPTTRDQGLHLDWYQRTTAYGSPGRSLSSCAGGVKGTDPCRRVSPHRGVSTLVGRATTNLNAISHCLSN